LLQTGFFALLFRRFVLRSAAAPPQDAPDQLRRRLPIALLLSLALARVHFLMLCPVFFKLGDFLPGVVVVEENFFAANCSPEFISVDILRVAA